VNSTNPVLATPAVAQPAVASPAAPAGAVVPSPFSAVGGTPPPLDPALLLAEPSGDQVQRWWDALVAAGLDVRQPAALLVQLEAILLARVGLDDQQLVDNTKARAVLVRELVGLALTRLGPALEQAGAVAGALPVVSPILDYVTGQESALSTTFQVQGDVAGVLSPAFPGLATVVAGGSRLAGLLTSDDPAAQRIRDSALEFARGVGDGIASSGLAQEPASVFFERAQAKGRELHVFLATVVDGGLLYGIFVQPLVDIAGLVDLVFGELAAMIETLSHLLTAALSDPGVAYQLGALVGKGQADSLATLLGPETSAATFYFALGRVLGELASDTVLTALGATLLVVVGRRVARATTTTGKVAETLAEVAEGLPASAKGRQRVQEALQALGDDYANRWRSLLELAEGSEAALRAVERLLAKPELRKLVDDLAEFNREAEDEVESFQRLGAGSTDDFSESIQKAGEEVAARRAQTLAVLERIDPMGDMGDLELDGVAVYRRLFEEEGAIGSAAGKKGGNQDMAWYHLLHDPGLMASAVGDHPIVKDLFVLLAELDPVANSRGLTKVLVNLWAGWSTSWGAIGVLYTARKLARLYPGSRFDFEIPKGTEIPGERRDVDILVDFVEDQTLPPHVVDYLLACEVKNVTSIGRSQRLRGQIGNDLIRHIVGGDLDFARLRWFLPSDQFATLSSQLADEFRAALWDQSVVDAMLEVNADPGDVAQRLEAALAGGLIDSFDVPAPTPAPGP
jgi:hypothetical protein